MRTIKSALFLLCPFMILGCASRGDVEILQKAYREAITRTVAMEHRNNSLLKQVHALTIENQNAMSEAERAKQKADETQQQLDEFKDKSTIQSGEMSLTPIIE